LRHLVFIYFIGPETMKHAGEMQMSLRGSLKFQLLISRGFTRRAAFETSRNDCFSKAGTRRNARGIKEERKLLYSSLSFFIFM